MKDTTRISMGIFVIFISIICLFIGILFGFEIYLSLGIFLILIIIGEKLMDIYLDERFKDFIKTIGIITIIIITISAIIHVNEKDTFNPDEDVCTLTCTDSFRESIYECQKEECRDYLNSEDEDLRKECFFDGLNNECFDKSYKCDDFLDMDECLEWRPKTECEKGTEGWIEEEKEVINRNKLLKYFRYYNKFMRKPNCKEAIPK